MSGVILVLAAGIALLFLVWLVIRDLSESDGTSIIPKKTRYDSPHRKSPDLCSDTCNLQYDKDGTPYGAMDAEFEDWG